MEENKYSIKTHVKTSLGWLSKEDKEDWNSIFEMYRGGLSFLEISKILKLAHTTVKNYLIKFDYPLRTKEEDVRLRREKTKQTCLKRYGTEAPLQNSIIKDKAKQTNLTKYGVVSASKLDSTKEKVKQTCVDRYGVEYHTQATDVKEKIRQTCLEKYGVDNVFKVEEHKRKFKQTCLEKYGIDNPFKVEEHKRKFKQTCLEKYGVDNPFKCDEIKNKIKCTCLDKYGVEHPLQNRRIWDRVKETFFKKYGVDNPNKDKSICNRSKKTCLERYGVDNPNKDKSIRNRSKKTCLERYGVENPAQLPEIKIKIKRTLLDNKRKIIEDVLKENNYILLEEYNGMCHKTDEGIYISSRQYKVKHLDCNNIFKTTFQRLSKRKLCPYCFSGLSNGETIYKDFVSTLDNNAIINTKSIIPPLELDIFLKKYNTSFEYNGSYWHSILHSRISKNYHKNKTELCLNKGIRLFHIWEHDNEEIIKSLIRVKLGKIENKYYARKLRVKEVNIKERRDFFNKNHLHGDVNSTFALGLYNNNELVQCISFRKHKEGMEIARLATKLDCNVVGGFSKLLKHSIIKIKELDYSKIVTYCNRDWTPDYRDSVYYKNGFEFLGDSGPQLKYYNSKLNIVENREKYQKHKLKQIFPKSYSKELTADEILYKERIYPVYNSGNWKFSLNLGRINTII